MSKTAVQKRPITVPVSGGCDVLWDGLGPKPKPSYVPDSAVIKVHLMNVEQRQLAADPQTKPPDLGCESACKLLSSTAIIAISVTALQRLLLLCEQELTWLDMSLNVKK